MHDQDGWGWCTGMTQRDGIQRKVGRVFMMGTHVQRLKIKKQKQKTVRGTSLEVQQLRLSLARQEAQV